MISMKSTDFGEQILEIQCPYSNLYSMHPVVCRI
jgi:hypothetical protein